MRYERTLVIPGGARDPRPGSGQLPGRGSLAPPGMTIFQRNPMDSDPLDDLDRLFGRLEPAPTPAGFRAQTLARAHRAARRRLLWGLADLLALGLLALMTFSLSWTLFSSDAGLVVLGLGPDLITGGASPGDLV